MTYDLFSFNFHTVRHNHPKGISNQFGNGYSYGVRPKFKPLRTFILDFSGLRYFIDENRQFSYEIEPESNILTLDRFYEEHGQHRKFLYSHEIFGNLLVKFSKPFEMPKALAGGSGLTEPFTIELQETLG